MWKITTRTMVHGTPVGNLINGGTATDQTRSNTDTPNTKNDEYRRIPKPSIPSTRRFQLYEPVAIQVPRQQPPHHHLLPPQPVRGGHPRDRAKLTLPTPYAANRRETAAWDGHRPRCTAPLS